MSNGPSAEPQSNERGKRRRIWAKTGLTLGAIAVLGLAGGALWLWIWVNERFAPWASQQLTDTLDRPVYLGEVERVSLTGVRFGQSAMPPTEDDPDQLVVDAVVVRLNPLELLTRTLSPRIIFEHPVAYVEQNAQGQWIEFEFEEEEEEEPETEPLIQLNPTIEIQGGEVAVAPYSPPDAEPLLPLTLEEIDALIAIEQVDTVDFRDQESEVEAQEIAFEVSTESEGGIFFAQGVVQQPDFGDDAPPELENAVDANIAIRAQDGDLEALSPILWASLPLEEVPFAITSGTLNGNVEIDISPLEDPRLTGTARVEEGAIAFNGLATPLTDIDGVARFQGNRIALEDVSAELGALAATAQGVIDTRTGYNLTGEIAPTTLAGIAETFDFEYPIPVESTLRAQAVTMTGPLAQPIISGRVESTEVTTLDQVQFADAASQVTYTVGESVAFEDFAAALVAGGSLTGQGLFTFRQPDEGAPAQFALQLQGRGIAADAIARDYGLVAANFSLGTLALDADISGPVSDLSGVVSWDAPEGTYPTRGTAEVAANTVRLRNAELAGGTLAGIARFINGQWTADLTAQGLQLGVFNENLAGVAAGGNVQLAGSTANFSLPGIRGTGDVTASLRGGTLNSQFVLANGGWDADVQTRNFPIGQFTPDVPIGNLSADAQFSGTLADFSLASIQGRGDLSAAIASGSLVSDFTLANGTFRLDGEGANIQLAQLTPDLQGTADATFQLRGNVADLSLAGLQGRANLRLSAGLASAAAVNPALLSARAPLEANVVWTGQQLQIENLETAGLVARGTITPLLGGIGAPGISDIDLDIEARDFDLAALPLNLPPALGLAGRANFEGRVTGRPGDLAFVGEGALADLALNDLIFDPLLEGDITFSTAEGLAVSLLGEQDEISVDYNPQERGLDLTVRAGEAIALAATEGDLLQAQLYNFPISLLNIPPATAQYGRLRGEIEFATATVNLNTLNATGQFDVQNLGIGFYSVDRLFGGFRYADGVARLVEGQILMADRDARGDIIAARTYDLSGQYAFDQTPQLQATLSTDEGQLRDVLEILKIQELADFRRGFTPNEGFIPGSQAEAEAILATNPVGNPNASLLNQLRRLSEIIESEIQAELQADQSRLPPLSELQGSFRGNVDLTATLPEDIQVEFDLAGESWEWGTDIRAETVIAQGTYQNGVISLSPLQFSSDSNGDPAYVILAGDFSVDVEDMEDRQMTLEVVNVPIDQLEDLANLPFDLDGRLNATALLQGQLADPDLAGQLEIVDGTLNNNPIDSAGATFAYAAARAVLDAQLSLLGSDDPLTLSAQIPYQFAFVEAEPLDRTYAVRANVVDEGFALLNLFTDQLIAWESGEGELILNLEGNIDDPFSPDQFDGLILLDGATISSRALPAPMTNVTGRIRLVPTGFLIVVDSLTGQFSEGELAAQGTFPLLVPLENLADLGVGNGETSETEPMVPPEAEASPETDDEEAETEQAIAPSELLSTPLTLDLNNIALDLRGLYNGQVNGLMQLGGSLVTGPALSGEIDLSNGTITIPEGADAVARDPVIPEDNGESLIPPFQFDNLRIVLARNINIVQGNLLNVRAQGGLRIDGSLDALRPFGTIQLPSGRVGLFAVSLRLAGNNDRAEFRGNFDPILDVTLQTALPDVAPGTVVELTTSPFPRNEAPDVSIQNIGLTQQGNSLVRINARYTGPASELANLTTDSRNLQLSSSPPRSDQEIISLLSGNVIGALDALGNGDQALTGIGTLVGSALLAQVRDFLGDTVPISEFRIFQVNQDTGGVNEGQDLGGEIGFDITSNISVSVLKVLTNDTPFQFNTRYRISDQFTVRGTTSFEDFNDRTGVLLEYETRF